MTQSAIAPGRATARVTQAVVPVAMTAAAAVAWWASVAAPMPMGMVSFLLGWLVMMAAMMLPALIPVMRLYQRAAARHTVAPVPVFLAGYLSVWTAAGIPAYFAWRQVQPAVMASRRWIAVLLGVALLLAAGYQLTPVKQLCLRGCRSPLTALSAVRGSLARPGTALRVGARNGVWCLGCCWALMAVLVTVGVMQPWWMVGIAAVIFAEKVLPIWRATQQVVAVGLAAVGLLLLAHPAILMTVTTS